MLIRSICVAKDECDVISQSLTAAAEWSDFIYFYDNGSTDGTWEIVQDLALKIPQIIPVRRDAIPFREHLRKVPFNHYRQQASNGDWWCRLDSDEFYIDSPREFLATVPEPYDMVCSASFQYYLTEKDVERFRADPAQYADEVPLEQKCRYYINNWSELRFFKHHRRLRWGSGAFPYPLMRAYDRRIRLKHYQYRSPHQIEKRLATRKDTAVWFFSHETRADWNESILRKKVVEKGSGSRNEPYFASVWTERVIKSSELIYDNGSDYIITEDLLPKITDSSATVLGRLKSRVLCVLADVLPG